MEQHTFREWRRLQGKSQESVARALGISTTTLRLKEKGLRPFNENEIDPLLKIYGITYEQVTKRLF